MANSDSRIKKIIETQVLKILNEDEPKAAASAASNVSTPKSAPEEKSKGKITRGAIGRGKIKDKINDAKALASKDPIKLMKNLGVSGASGNSLEKKVLSVIRSAIYGTDTMREAYLGASIRKDEQSDKDVVAVATRDLSARDGALYVLHILTAADNIDMFGSYENEIEVGVEGDGVIIKFK